MEVGGYSYDFGAVEEGCRTPERGGCQIPAASVCPPAPKKKAAADRKQRREPKNGYFQPPDLEIFFAMAHGREAYACCGLDFNSEKNPSLQTPSFTSG